MRPGLPANLTWYDLLKDQGSLIAGAMALLAGFLAYRAGMQQAAAADRQLRENVRQQTIEVLLETLAGSRLLEGILLYTLDRIERGQKLILINSPGEAMIGLEKLPLHEISRALGLMHPAFVTGYYAAAAAITAAKRGDTQTEINQAIGVLGVSARIVEMPERFQALENDVRSLLSILLSNREKVISGLQKETTVGIVNRFVAASRGYRRPFGVTRAIVEPTWRPGARAAGAPRVNPGQQ